MPTRQGVRRGEEGQHARAPQCSRENSIAFFVRPVHLKDVLGEIDPDDGRLVNGWLPWADRLTTPTMAHRDAESGSHPPHQWRGGLTALGSNRGAVPAQKSPVSGRRSRCCGALMDGRTMFGSAPCESARN